jgi:hypothetical protein
MVNQECQQNLKNINQPETKLPNRTLMRLVSGRTFLGMRSSNHENSGTKPVVSARHGFEVDGMSSTAVPI